MRKNKNTFFKRNLVFLIIVFSVVVLEFFIFLFYYDGISIFQSLIHKDNVSVPGIILFYSNNCPQCVKVDAFVKNNSIEDKVTFTKLEVSDNSTNRNILEDKAQICGLNPTLVGVPFLWDGKNCSIGYVDVINFFKSQNAKFK